MPKLDDLHVLVSPITGKIYVGTLNADGTSSNKRDMTDEIISAVANHLDQENAKYEMAAGTLLFERKEQEGAK